MIYAKDLALKYINKAVKILNILPDCEQKALMIDIANNFLKRNINLFDVIRNL
ncbi:hypothetical protein [Thermoanaerobacterium sp. RBIITD]|uniref:hypothetical protein n=1 Tax=Thermoanaerobacterium sp. RBIITD TaxID=1550240 RepID=UPI001E4C1819|nr:hypothetical protein [Thermoanaerobacterium sp. RBIITD]